MRKPAVIGTAFATVLFLGGGIFNTSKASSNTTSSFNEVWKVVTVNPDVEWLNGQNLGEVSGRAQQIHDMRLYGTPDDPRLPQHSGSIGVLTSIVVQSMKKAAVRTIESRSDYHDYFRKLVHANGTCFAGTWEITEDSNYSGAFRKGTSDLIIGRISAASPQTTNDQNRSFGFAGKVFPTMDPNAMVRTANFFTVHDLNGTDAKQMLDVALVNEPPVDLSGKLNPLTILLKVFQMADVNPTIRPLYPLARAGLPPGESPRSPKWMRLRVAAGVQSSKVADADFRDELSAKNYPNGLTFVMEASDTTKDPNVSEGWTVLGRIRTSAFVTSYGCDRRLHFSHPTFNDPEAIAPSSTAE